MKTMYDKLGDLLSEALRTGQIPQTDSDPSKVSFFYVSEQDEDNKESESHSEKKESPSDKNPFFSSEKSAVFNREKRKSETIKSIFQPANIETGLRIPREKIIPPKVEQALSFIGIDLNSTYADAKRIYREKLMYYHPDRRNANPVLQKVAKEKTERLLKEWKILEEWYENKNEE